jgi:hypothetical protein
MVVCLVVWRDYTNYRRGGTGWWPVTPSYLQGGFMENIKTTQIIDGEVQDGGQ